MVMMIVVALTSTVFASTADNLDWNITINANSTDLANNVSGVMGQALYIMQVVGMGVAIIMLIVLAIKYISAAPGDKADIKKHAVVYVVGAIVLFAASGILGIVKKFASNIQ